MGLKDYLEILNPDGGINPDFEKKLDRRILIIEPRIRAFKRYFIKDNCFCPVMICTPEDFNLYRIKEETASECNVGYFDLSQVRDGDYELITKKISDWEYGGILFDNIDAVPEISEKRDFEELVRFALKREDDFPIPGKKYLNFSQKKIGCKATEYPDYLKGKSTYAYIIVIDENSEMLDENEI